MRAIRRFTVRPVLPPALLALGELAGNLRWSWHPPTQDVFAQVDEEIWEATGHDPVRLLGAVSPGRLEELAGDQGFLDRLGEAKADLDAYLGGDRWYARKAGADAPTQIAYFSPEFGITAVLPQYSGGLGILAGDHLKAASDLGVPLVGVGLLYHAGYFKQSLSHEGWQLENYPVLDPDELPISLLREENGERAVISIALPDGPELLAKIWVAQVGRVPLLLLDSDVEGNPDHYRDVTDRLYGGTSEHRLRQELLLGVGGVRALRVHARITGASEPEVFHTNEGHAGFLGLERIRELTVDETGPKLDFDTALEISRASTVFTTHTPVPAGIDRFARELMEQYFGTAGALPGLPLDRILALGAEDYQGGDPTVFNMAVMGFRLAQRANGVSQLHGHVSREMFHGLWPAFDEAEVPITSITNGVHASTWVGREVFELAGRFGADGGSDDVESFWSAVDHVPGGDIWAVKRQLRERLVVDARKRVLKSSTKRGTPPAESAWVETALDPDVLTIGFARRVPSYKRLTLMLRDEDRLRALLRSPDRPVQIVIAGKSHPADDTGKQLIAEIVKFSDDPAVRHRITFLPDYDIGMARYLYWGVDVWLNNPLRPLEACGTSGMKAGTGGRSRPPMASPTRTGATTWKRTRCTTSSSRTWRRASTTATRAACRGDGCRWCATPLPRSVRRWLLRGWSATTSACSTPRPPRPRLGWRPRTSRPRGPWQSGAPACSTRGRESRCCTSTRSSAAMPSSAVCSRCAPRWPSTGSRPTMSTSRRCTGRWTSTSGSSTSRRCR